MFEDFFGGMNLPASCISRSAAVSPAIDIVESDKGYQITAELPAMDSDDVDISVHDNCLTIKGEKKDEKEEKNEYNNIVRSERYYGHYQRTVSLPQDADTAGACASFKKGVLHIEVPKKDEGDAKSHKIQIKSE